MTRDPRYDVLFEPVKIGPVTAKNRFFQVPHCNTLGHGRPRAEAENRRIKAEGGWGVICTQEVEIHPSADLTPWIEGRIWDDRDIPGHRMMTDAVHQYGALAGIELAYNASHAQNLYSRIAPMAPGHRHIDGNAPMQARAMTKKDIRDIRRWHVDAAKRSKIAGYDIVYVYASHDMSILQHLMKSQYNHRSDEYGGSLENRVRLTREVLSDIKEAVGDTCAIAFRFAVDELLGADGLQFESEGQDVVGMLAELPDLWDVNISGWSNDSATARFEPDEGYQEKYTAFVKSMTSKPVVGVGRFTSADAMVSQIKRGVLDLIGAARPSIADPFLPNKIDEGRIEDIRECIGCNICVAQDMLAAPIRCTQNPTQGEEWKRNWHPEKIAKAKSDDEVLVVGAGPSGLEATLSLARRGYRVTLAEAKTQVGGRLNFESQLPGLASYARVSDYRKYQIEKLSNVDIYLDNQLGAEDIRTLEKEHVLIATGSTWRVDGVGRQHNNSIPGVGTANILSPQSLFRTETVKGRVLIYDDDHYYLGSVLAEECRRRGWEVCIVTPDSIVASWTANTLEQEKIQSRLMDLDVEIITSHQIDLFESNNAWISNVYSDRHQRSLEFECAVLLTTRTPNESLYLSLSANAGQFKTLQAIGDCHAPGTVASAVYDGHLAAENLQEEQDYYAPLFVRETIDLAGSAR